MKKKKKQKSKCCYDKFEDFKLPPCAKFLGNQNPLIKDREIIYKNINRVYFFLTYNYLKFKDENYNTLNPASFNFKSIFNLQIEPYYFFIGLYINEVQKGNIKYDSNTTIHEDKNADGFIKNILEEEYEIDNYFVPSLTYAISNSSAILPLYYGTVEISIINFYIILMLSRFYSDFGLLFSDNAYVTNDFINNTLANLYVEFNNCNYT